MPIVPAPWEAEIEGSWSKASPGKKISKTLSEKQTICKKGGYGVCQGEGKDPGSRALAKQAVGHKFDPQYHQGEEV
jgi:hypothetical protein